MTRVRAVMACAALSLVLVAGCGSETTTGSTPEPTTVTVFAAASLKAAFIEIGEQFRTDNPGTEVEFSFAGSSDLVTQLTQGAAADVFASADQRNMTKAADAGLLAGDPVNFASNTLTIAVAPGNPKGINAFEDLTRPGLDVVVCAPQVPCGGATEKVEKATGVDLTPVSEESSVTDVLNKVTSGQADAGIVYVTDAVGAADKVTAVPFAAAQDAVNTYPIAPLSQSAHAELAKKFIDAVTREAGRKVLAAAGFAEP